LADVEQAIQAQQDRITQAGPGLFGVIEQGLSVALLEGAEGKPNPLDENLANLYAGEVSYVDEQIGRLLDGLKRRGILDEAIVIVTADHGETFWEHADFWNHGLCVYQTTVQVPLIIRLPDALPVVHDVETAVSAVDILPTVLDLLGLPVPATVEGISLRPAIENRPFDRGPVFAEATQPVGRLEQGVEWGNSLKAKTVRQGPWKYIWTPYLDHEELYNLKQDPRELTNLLAEPTTAIRQRRDDMRAELDAWIASGHPLASHFNPEQQHEVLERLRSLGYVGGGDSVD
jgi:arylsulfatase A-like enzyme